MVFSNYLMQALREQVVGHEYALNCLTRAVTLALSGRRAANRPLAVLLFVGPSGSGKIHVAQSLARILMGSERKLIYINCPQLAQATNPLSNLYEQMIVGDWYARLSLPVLTLPFSIVVIEKIDKAPPAFRDQLAAAINRGELYAQGQLLSLRNSFLILTSDLSKKLTDQLTGRTIGFFRENDSGEEPPRQQQLVLEEFDHLLGDYLVNRIDEIIIFESFNEQNIITLLEEEITAIEQYLARLSIGFLIEPEARTFLLRHCLEDMTHGLRQIKRIVRNHLEFPLADMLISRRLTPGATVIVKYEALRSYLHFQILIPRLEPASPPGLPQKARAIRADGSRQ